jgi:hypothetical protein
LSSTSTQPATRAIEAVLDELQAAGIDASRDAGAFFPQPIGTLVGLPELVRRTHGARIFELPVLVVSGDPLNSELTVDRLYSLVDDVARVLSAEAYRVSSWRSSVNAEPLPAVEVVAVVTVTETAPLALIEQEASHATD